VWTQEDRAVAAVHSVDVDHWCQAFDALMSRIGLRFGRIEPRRRAGRFVRGLMAGLGRVNCWSIAEHAGEARPDGMQHLLGRARWDADGVRDDLRDYVVEHLGHADAVLIFDETGDVKKGAETVGVQRQYTGTAGRIENSQVAVYLVYASPTCGVGATGPGRYAFIDRALYLPKSWTQDSARMSAAAVPHDVEFATKPALARQMLTRALTAGVPARWCTGDEVYGNDPNLRKDLVTARLGYVLAVAKDHRITTGVGVRKAVELAVRLPKHAWQCHSAGPGAKGLRLYDWALVETSDKAADPDGNGRHWLLIRRHPRTGELAFYRAHAPTNVPLQALVTVAGTRWRIEESFQSGKELTGLDEHQVRRWHSWHRWTVLAMLAHAFLSVMTATTQTQQQTNPPTEPSNPSTLIPLTRNEIRRLFSAANTPAQTPTSILNWSRWRRQHQARARASHYRHRELIHDQ
jgi:SRSO17 transposase